MAYLGEQANDVKQNKGLYTPSEILQLTKDGSWGGSLELIEEQTVSSASALDFTSIKENVYDVHYLVGGFTQQSDNISIRLSNDNGSSFISSGYGWAQQEGQTGGIFGTLKSTSASFISYFALAGTGGNDSGNSYCYLYNLGNSSKYSFVTNQSIGFGSSLGKMTFGGGVQPTAQIINAIRIRPNSGTFSGTVKLFGMKEI